MKAIAVAKALVCLATAITEVLPAERRRSVDHILRSAIDDGLIDDRDTVRVLQHFIGDHPRAD
jgi:hypothetical protein